MRPIFEEHGYKIGSDVFIAHCPERINPGDKEHTITKILKITSGSTPEIAQKVDRLYQSIITAGTHLASSIKVAEAAKVIENTQRDVNIALINELETFKEKHSKEFYYEVPSDKIPFDQKPKMKAAEITEKSIELLKSGKYRFGRINLANGDMVGHTGVMEAAVIAMETVDECVARLIKVVDELDGITVITADHGNSDEMWTEKNGVRTPKTAHTLNPVPFIIVDKNFNGEYRISPSVKNPGLANVAGTLLTLLGFENVADYEPSIIEIK